MNITYIKTYFGLLMLINSLSSSAQKQISITVDDPTTIETPKMSFYERNDAMLKILDKHNIKAALFVCGMRVDDADGKNMISKWDSKNHLICNHSYSHHYYNSKTSAVFIADFKKGDSTIKNYNNYTKLFRFPYLKEGNTASKRDSMRIVMKNEGYRNGHVTIDASDWYINAQITNKLKEDINADLTPYKEYYIKHILDRAHYYDSLAVKLFSRDIKHTLLIHHSLLNALFLDDLLMALKTNGWTLINAKTAYEDIIQLELPIIEPCGESIVWQCAKLSEELSKTLRYPAEDGKYEKELLENYIKGYDKQINKKTMHSKGVK